MKIALISPYDFAHPGGVINHIRALDEEFTRLGHDVRIIAPASRKKVAALGNRFIPIGKPRPVPSSGSISRISLSLHLAPDIKRVLKSEKFDVVHLHEPFMPMLCSAVLRFSSGINIGTFHAYSGSPGYELGWPITTILLKRRNRKLAGRIAVSTPAKAYASKYVDGEFTVIPNGVDLKRFHPGVKPMPGYDDGKINILFVGRLEKRKGCNYLLNAYARLKKKYPNIRLIIVGPGVNLRRRYEFKVRFSRLKDVVFTGGVPYEELPRYYQTADIFCAPATGKESFGIVLLEAMALGKPIVATSNDGYASVVTHGEQGLLVPPKNIKALAEALKRLIEDGSLRGKLGANGLKTVQSYDWPLVARRVLDYYQQVSPLADTSKACAPSKISAGTPV
ncbi:MAG: glycosyltransferase family 1 protein [Dehalococcoidia bacterium]|nr:MAG: glycosyltransferase family 1 protein [Dehalococcoidia bacterium]